MKQKNEKAINTPNKKIKQIAGKGTNKNLAKRFKKIVDSIYVSKFMFTNIKNIDIDLLKFFEEKIDRQYATKKINLFVSKLYLAKDIEKSISEYALINVMTNSFEYDILESIYYSKLNDICNNLDVKNSKINNQYLLNAVEGNRINCLKIAFLKPYELNPIAWISYINKSNVKLNITKNIKTTDMYDCKKCGSNKFVYIEMQIRGLDEPATKFYECTNCAHTFTTGN